MLITARQYAYIPVPAKSCGSVEDVYKNVGASEILPHLMKCLDADKIHVVQFLRAGKVRLTVDDAEVCSAVLRNGLELEGLSVQLMPADDRLSSVYLRDLPVEVDNDVVSSFLPRYGEVLSVDHCYFDDFPSLCNGNRLVKILLAQDIPSFVRVESYECRVWYPREPPQCSICRNFVHRAPACPLSGLSAGAVASPVMWPGSVHRLGALLFLFLVLLLMALLMNLILLWNNRLAADLL